MTPRTRRILLFAPLAAIALAVVTAGAAAWALLHTESGARWLVSFLQERAPGELQVGRIGGDLGSGLEIDALGFRNASLDLGAGRVELAVSPEFFPFRVRVARLYLSDVRYRLKPGDGEAEPFVLPDSLALPFELYVDDLRLAQLTVLDADAEEQLSVASLAAKLRAGDRLVVESAELETAPAQLALNGGADLAQPYAFEFDLQTALSLPLGEASEPLDLELTARLAGEAAQYTVDAAGWLQPPDFKRHDYRFGASGTLQSLTVSQLEITGPEAEFAARAEVDWVEKFLALSGLRLAVPESTLRLQADLRIDLAGGSLEGRAAWTDFTWPLLADDPVVVSRSGEIVLAGTPGDWSVSGDAALEGRDFPRGHLAFEASGDRERTQLTILDGDVLGGRLAGQGSWDWSQGNRIDAEWRLEAIDTTALYPEFPVLLSGEVGARGTLEPLDLDLSVHSLDAEAHGLALQASGGLRVQPAALDFSDFELRATGSSLSLDGRSTDPEGVAFAADIRDLGELIPDTAGALQGRGRIAADPDQPVLRLDLHGQGLEWQDFRVPAFTVRDTTTDASSPAALIVELRQPTYAGQTLDEATLALDFGRLRQSLRVRVAGAGHEFEAAVNGQLPGEAWPLDEAPWSELQWEGQLGRLSWRHQGERMATLAEAAGLSLSADALVTDSACIDGPDQSRICAEGGWDARTGSELSLQLAQVSLAPVARLLETGFELTQSVSGEVSWSGGQGASSGTASLQLSPGRVVLDGDDTPLFETGEGALGFSLENGVLSAGSIDIPIPGQGEIDLDFGFADVQAGLESALDGRLKIDFADLDLLSPFLPVADELSGRLHSDLGLSGTIGNPHFSGRVALEGGRLSNSASGLALTDIQLSGDVMGNDETRMTGSFRTAEGTGRLDAVLDFSDILSPVAELTIAGENLKLFDAESLTVTATPDINLAWRKGILEIGGSLAIPGARIAPSVIPVATVSESPDLVIVSGGLETDPEGEDDSGLKLRGDLEVVLGDDVRIDLSIAEADVSGSVNFSWRDELLPMASGNYSMVGQILAFGQLLQITEGNIGFPQVPADNPHLNIRAERQIYGNSEIRRAGVFVTGTLRRPVIEPYTDPMTNRERAQTLLVTGSDFNMERGVGAVDIGTYIAPRIFVSYGLGVFEDENVISIRYDLGRNWGIKATSGERQTGIDMSYTLER